MAEIKPDEISAILRQQLGNFNAGAELEEVGTVLQVGDGIARVYGLNNVRSGELVEFETGVKAIALNLEEDNVGVVLMGESAGIKEGAKVRVFNDRGAFEGDARITTDVNAGVVVATLGYWRQLNKGTVNCISLAEERHSEPSAGQKLQHVRGAR